MTGTLQPGVVQVSFEPLPAPPSALADLLADLTPEERERASRLLPDDRRRFVAARAGLRHRLGALLNQRPPEVAIRRRRGGKPELAGPRPPALHFNLAHTADLAVYAIALDRQVGIDVETTRSIGPARALASRYFSAAEAELVRRAPAERASHLFLRLWVRKEALLKATGTGIAGRLRADVAAAVGIHEQPAAQRLIMLPSPGGWALREWSPSPCHLMALVCAGDWTIAAESGPTPAARS